jgi:DNA polymerase epsilon subunit 3
VTEAPAVNGSTNGHAETHDADRPAKKLKGDDGEAVAPDADADVMEIADDVEEDGEQDGDEQDDQDDEGADDGAEDEDEEPEEEGQDETMDDPDEEAEERIGLRDEALDDEPDSD